MFFISLLRNFNLIKSKDNEDSERTFRKKKTPATKYEVKVEPQEKKKTEQQHSSLVLEAEAARRQQKHQGGPRRGQIQYADVVTTQQKDVQGQPGRRKSSSTVGPERTSMRGGHEPRTSGGLGQKTSVSGGLDSRTSMTGGLEQGVRLTGSLDQRIGTTSERPRETSVSQYGHLGGRLPSLSRPPPPPTSAIVNNPPSGLDWSSGVGEASLTNSGISEYV